MKLLSRFSSLFIILIISPGYTGAFDESKQCSYNTWEWNTLTRKSENHRRVKKGRKVLVSEEKDPHSACTVCEEDQRTIEIRGIPPFMVCHLYSNRIRKALEKIVKTGWKIETVTAYRVGRSRGTVDEKGLRTQFSNHSFGTAIDILKSA